MLKIDLNHFLYFCNMKRARMGYSFSSMRMSQLLGFNNTFRFGTRRAPDAILKNWFDFPIRRIAQWKRHRRIFRFDGIGSDGEPMRFGQSGSHESSNFEEYIKYIQLKTRTR